MWCPTVYGRIGTVFVVRGGAVSVAAATFVAVVVDRVVAVAGLSNRFVIRPHISRGSAKNTVPRIIIPLRRSHDCISWPSRTTTLIPLRCWWPLFTFTPRRADELHILVLIAASIGNSSQPCFFRNQERRHQNKIVEQQASQKGRRSHCHDEPYGSSLPATGTLNGLLQ